MDGRLFIEVGGSSSQSAWRDKHGVLRFASGVVRRPGWEVALACPGLIRGERVLYAANLGWPDVANPAEQLGLERVDVVVNDAVAAALGESVLQCGGSPAADLLYLSLGTGVGAARVEGGAATDSSLGHLHIGGGIIARDAEAQAA